MSGESRRRTRGVSYAAVTNPHLFVRSTNNSLRSLDRCKEQVQPSVFDNNAQRPAASDNGGRLIFVRQANGSFQGQYSDGTNWQTFLSTGISYAMPSITYSTAYGAGAAGTTIRSDAVLKFPTALMSSANSATLTLTDNATDVTLANSLGSIHINTPGIILDSPASASSIRMNVNLDLDYNTVGIQSAWSTGTPTNATTLSCWDAKYSSLSAAFSNNTVIGFDTSLLSINPTAGSSGTNHFYGIRTLPVINTSNGTWGDVSAAYFRGARRLVSSPTVTTLAGVIVEPPTLSTADQIGIYIRQQSSQATPTNRIGLKIDAQNIGTNKYAIHAITDQSYLGPILQDDSVKLKQGTAQDAEIYYDGTDLILDPDVVGTGSVRHKGKTALEDDTTISDAKNVILNTTTGTKVGTATTQKLGFWNSAPVIQPATTGTASSMVGGGGAAVDDKATFTGGVGATAYRIDDIVNNLKTCGILKT